jgi:hypothetical protein
LAVSQSSVSCSSLPGSNAPVPQAAKKRRYQPVFSAACSSASRPYFGGAPKGAPLIVRALDSTGFAGNCAGKI